MTRNIHDLFSNKAFTNHIAIVKLQKKCILMFCKLCCCFKKLFLFLGEESCKYSGDTEHKQQAQLYRTFLSCNFSPKE